jgi:hypothetical protein
MPNCWKCSRQTVPSPLANTPSCKPNSPARNKLSRKPLQTRLKNLTSARFEQKVAWAAKTEFKGDVRVRQETVKIDGESDGKNRDRQRIRARLGAYTEINPQVNTGIRIATGGSDDARSTNQDLDNYFDKKQLWLDHGLH